MLRFPVEAEAIESEQVLPKVALGAGAASDEPPVPPRRRANNSDKASIPSHRGGCFDARRNRRGADGTLVRKTRYGKRCGASWSNVTFRSFISYHDPWTCTYAT